MSVVIATAVNRELNEAFLHDMLHVSDSEEMEKLLVQLEDKSLQNEWTKVRSASTEALDEELNVHRTGSGFVSRAKILLYQKAKEFKTQ